MAWEARSWGSWVTGKWRRPRLPAPLCHPPPESESQGQESPGSLLPNSQGLAASSAADARRGVGELSLSLAHRASCAPPTLENTPIHFPLLWPSYSLKQSGIEIRPIKNLTMASKYSSERKSTMSLIIKSTMPLISKAGTD